MEIVVYCVGKLDKGWSGVCGEYLERIGHFCRIRIVEIAEPRGKFRNPGESVALSSACLLEKIGESPLVLLDRAGKPCSSEEFSALLMGELQRQPSRVSLVIGASDGVSDMLRKRARQVVSFSKLTFPHQLFRVMLLEQVYRAFAIARGLPYHK